MGGLERPLVYILLVACRARTSTDQRAVSTERPPITAIISGLTAVTTDVVQEDVVLSYSVQLPSLRGIVESEVVRPNLIIS